MAYLKWLFRGLCVLLSVCATIWPVHVFNLNEDALEIELKDLHSSKDTLYPGIRLCFAHSILKEYTKPSRNTLRTKNLLQDGPDSASFQINHYIRNIVIIHANKTRPKFTRAGIKIQRFRSIQRKGNFTHIVLRRFRSSDCLDVGVPFKENTGIHSISVEIERDIFKKNAVPTRNEILSGTSKVKIGMSSNGNIFYLPNQNGGDLLFNDQIRGSCSAVVFDVKGMELFYRRKKPGVPCIGYDGRGMFKFLTRSTKKLGCMPPGLDLPINLPQCLGNKRKAAANIILAAFQQFSTYPCRSIRDLRIEYNFEDSKNTCKIHNEGLKITAIFNKFLFKEIKVVRAFTIGKLASSIGVIIGIFYGVSLIEVPEMVKKSRKKIRRDFSKKEPKLRTSQILIHQALGALRMKMWELNGKFENAKKDIALKNNQTFDTLRNEVADRIEGLRSEVGELNEVADRIEGLRSEVGELNEKFQSNNHNLDTMRQDQNELNEELQNSKKDITLIKNHMIQCLQKKEYETVVIMI